MQSLVCYVFVFQLMVYYGIKEFKNTDEFLTFLALRFGMLRKGGIPAQRKAAKKVLTDWVT